MSPQERLVLLAGIVGAGSRSVFEAQRSLEYCWLGPAPQEAKADVARAVQWVTVASIASGAASKNSLANPTGDPRRFAPVSLAAQIVHISLRVHPLALCHVILGSPSLRGWTRKALEIGIRSILVLWKQMLEPSGNHRIPEASRSVDGDASVVDDVARDTPAASPARQSSEGTASDFSSGLFGSDIARTACKLHFGPAGLIGLTVAALLSRLEATGSDARSAAAYPDAA